MADRRLQIDLLILFGIRFRVAARDYRVIPHIVARPTPPLRPRRDPWRRRRLLTLLTSTNIIHVLFIEEVRNIEE
jgi:hypothetical protein